MNKLVALLAILVISGSLQARGEGGRGGDHEGQHFNEAYRGGGDRYAQPQVNRDARQFNRYAGDYGVYGGGAYWEGNGGPVNPFYDEQQGYDIYQTDKNQ